MLRIVPAAAAAILLLTACAGTPPGASITPLQGAAGNPVRGYAGDTLGSDVSATPSSCGDTLRCQSAQRWQEAFGQPVIDDWWLGGDIGLSVQTTAGDIWWLFGDSLVTSERDTPRLVTSSSLVALGGDPGELRRVHVADSVGEPMPAFLPTPRGGGKSWPAAALLAEDDEVWVFATDIDITGSGPWDFGVSGSSLHRYRISSTPTPTAVHLTSVELPQPVDGRVIQWGSAVLQRGEDVFVYGAGDGPGLGRDVFLARVPVDTVDDLQKWTYLDAKGTAAEIPTSIISPEVGLPYLFSVNNSRRLGELILIGKQFEGAGEFVVMSSSRDPWGPWLAFSPIAEAAPDGDYWRYAALTHPSIPQSGGEMLVSVSRNHVGPDGLQTILRSPTDYRPEFFAVPVPALDANQN